MRDHSNAIRRPNCFPYQTPTECWLAGWAVSQQCRVPSSFRWLGTTHLTNLTRICKTSSACAHGRGRGASRKKRRFRSPSEKLNMAPPRSPTIFSNIATPPSPTTSHTRNIWSSRQLVYQAFISKACAVMKY